MTFLVNFHISSTQMFITHTSTLAHDTPNLKKQEKQWFEVLKFEIET